jgi:hypothetical protein
MSSTKLLAAGLAGLWLGSGLGGCYDETIPEFADIGVRWLDSENNELGSECTPLPYLPGGTVDLRIDIRGGLTAHILGTSHSVEVTLEGTSDPVPPRTTITHDSLRLGYTGLMDAETPAGEHYRVVLFGPCDPVAAARLVDGGFVP